MIASCAWFDIVMNNNIYSKAQMKNVQHLSYAQRERLAFIDFSLNYFGEISRSDLNNQFQTGLAAATRDFSAYKELAPGNLELIHKSKSYHRKSQFKPLFRHDLVQILHSLTRGFGDGISSLSEPNPLCIEAPQLNQPSADVLSEVMRAIKRKQLLKISYVSLSSGPGCRIIVPHSLANNGCRWLIRAYDRLTSSFRDFGITRVKSITLLSEEVNDGKESISADKQWNRIVDLTLIPHPNSSYPEAIELDYDMTHGQLDVECRAALVGYLLNRLNVDCSQSHHLDSTHYQLALKENAALFGVENAHLAPGYQENNNEK